MSIKVGLYKMDDRSASRLRIVFKMVYKKQCVASDVGSADTVIVNLENQDPVQFIADFKQSFPNKPIILLADEMIAIDNIPCITRPCKLPDLLVLIKQTSGKSTIDKLDENEISQENQVTNNKPAQSTHSSKTIDIARRSADSLNAKLSTQTKKHPAKVKTEEESDIFYQPNNFLQGKVTSAIEKANKQNKTVFLRCWSHRWILVSPSSGFLVENIKERQLTNLGLVNIDNDVIFKQENFTEEQMVAMAKTPVTEVKATRIQKFVWDLAVRTARGRIPIGTLLDDLYVLEQWPNLTRLAAVPNSMRISAFWLDQPQSIANVSEKLKIPSDNVYTYFSAALATNIIKKAQRREDRMVNPEVIAVEKKRKGIMSSILKKLSRFTRTPKANQSEREDV